MNKFFKAARLSPAYIFQTLCGLSILYDGVKLSEENLQLEGLILTMTALTMVRVNFNAYTRLRRSIHAVGYDQRLADLYFRSHCGRNQLKMACQENGIIKKYTQHIAKNNIKWFHIDSNPALCVFYPTVFGLGFFSAVLSRYVRYQSEEKQKEAPHTKTP